MENTLLLIVEKFWHGLGITTTSTTVISVADDIDIRIETPDSALIIGIHGKNIAIFQHLLGRILEREVGHFVHVHLEINDYVKIRDEKLYRYIDSKMALATSSGVPVRMTNLSPYERKKAHNYIADKKLTGLSTHSEGEGANRSLIIAYSGEIIKRPPQIHTITSGQSTSQDILSDDGIGI